MKKLSLFLIALAMILVSCKPEIEKPTVVTKSVGEVTKTSAKVVGQVAADGGAEVFFENLDKISKDSLNPSLYSSTIN